MWIFLNKAFLSIVQDHKDPDQLLVRGRFVGDIESIWPDAKVVEWGGTDYRFRTFLPRKEVVDAMVQEIEALDYNNFKNSVSNLVRHDIYAEVWLAMCDRQARLDPEHTTLIMGFREP